MILYSVDYSLNVSAFWGLGEKKVKKLIRFENYPTGVFCLVRAKLGLFNFNNSLFVCYMFS